MAVKVIIRRKGGKEEVLKQGHPKEMDGASIVHAGGFAMILRPPRSPQIVSSGTTGRVKVGETIVRVSATLARKSRNAVYEKWEGKTPIYLPRRKGRFPFE